MSDRTRNWTFLVYPESAPSDWRDSFCSLGLPFACSPLHENDVNADGTLKKAHYHVLICFDSVKTQKQAQEISDMASGVLAIPCLSTIGTIRYFCHMDNPEKYQYNRSDIFSCGIDVDEILISRSTDKRKILFDILQFIEDNDITEFCDLVYAVASSDYADWFDMIMFRCTLSIKEVIKSRKFKSLDAHVFLKD